MGIGAFVFRSGYNILIGVSARQRKIEMRPEDIRSAATRQGCDIQKIYFPQSQ